MSFLIERECRTDVGRDFAVELVTVHELGDKCGDIEGLGKLVDTFQARKDVYRISGESVKTTGIAYLFSLLFEYSSLS